MDKWAYSGRARHHVASEEEEGGVAVEAAQTADDLGGVEVAGSLSGNKHIFHDKWLLRDG